MIFVAVNATVLKQLVVIGTNAKVTKEHDGNTFKLRMAKYSFSKGPYI